MIGTASASKHERLRAMGVAHVIDYRARNFEPEVRRITGGRGVDLALDAVGGRSFRKSYRCLAKLGRLFVFGLSSAAPGPARRMTTALKQVALLPRFNPLSLMKENRAVLGVNLGRLWDRTDLLRGMMKEIVERTAGGTFDPVVDRTFPFDRAADAHAYIHERKNFGKVLLTP